ncbi:hypothetical protein ACMFMG_007368 [Clarireedia jacksonii]
MAVPTPRRGLSPLLTSSTFSQDVSFYLDTVKADTKAKTPYMFSENDSPATKSSQLPCRELEYRLSTIDLSKL